MDLTTFPTGHDARIVAVDTEPGLALRMGELGLRVGAVVQIVHHAHGAGRVVAVGADRIALDLVACQGVRLVPVQ
ncbi:MAG: ferrous iron transport protein A [Micrococcales bacterium]|nr:ferrous iron transport protein A [Micrococcales bacterium]MCL2666493.1 ferrous iron transport protein A [Micrococcales bacterium]